MENAKPTPPVQTAPPQEAVSLSPVLQSVKAALSSLPKPRDWVLMCDRTGFHMPSNAQQARAKMQNNANIFKVNYAYTVFAAALAGLFFDLTALLLTLAALGSAAWLVSDTRVVGITMLQGITTHQRQVCAGALSIGTLLLSGAVGVAATGACVGAAACGVHGVLYEPAPDFS